MNRQKSPLLVRGILAILSSLALILAYSPYSSADSTAEEWQAIAPQDANGFIPGYIGVDSKPSEQLLTFTSYLLNFEGAEGNTTKVTACTSYSDSNCTGGYVMRSRAELQPCTTSNPTDCFKGLVVKDANGKALSATLVTNKVVPNNQVFAGDQSVWLPTGGSPLVYSIPEAAHDGGILYLVKPDVVMSKWAKDKTFSLDKFEAAIYPIKMKSFDNLTGVTPTIASVDAKDYPGTIGTAGSGGGGNCENGYNDGKNCFLPQAFPAGIQFGMNLRLSHGMYGWLHGRFFKPDIQITDNPVVATGIDLSIVATPIKVPVISGFIKYDAAPANVVNWYTPVPHTGGIRVPNGQAIDKNAPLSAITILHEHMDASEYTMQELRDWLSALGDTSAAEPSYWLVQTVLGGKVDEVDKCTKNTKALAGVVSTNATAYLPGPPTFDKTQGSLDYKVLAPHFLKDKSVNEGTYNLIINNDVARCIYSFTDAPIGATISVLASDGTNRVATTLVTQDKTYLKLQAAGFTFSDPTVRVKITQESAAPAPTPSTASSPTPTPVISSKVKSTISCVRGKTIKKVTAINPKCPTGYKKR